jgi:hypothetical protein
MGGSGMDGVVGIHCDGPGNVYVTGYFQGTVNFRGDWGGTDSKTSAGQSDGFVTKINADGSYGWTRRIGGATGDTGTAIVTDGSGNVYFTGRFSGTVNLRADWGGTDWKTAAGPYNDVYVTKVHADGSYGWTRRIGGNSWTCVNDITCDGSRNIYVTGDFRGMVNFAADWGAADSKTVALGNSDIFVTRINADGSYGWTRVLNGALRNPRLVGDGSGSVLLTGEFSGTVDFRTDWGGSDAKTSAGANDLFVTKIHTDGSYGWTHWIGGTGNECFLGIDTNRAGHLYLSGSFQGSVDFRGDWNSPSEWKTSQGQEDIFFLIVKY